MRKEYSFDIDYTECHNEIHGMIQQTSGERCCKATARKYIKRLLGDKKFVFKEVRFGMWEFCTTKGANL